MRGDVLVSCDDIGCIRRAEIQDAGELAMLAGLLWPGHDPAELRGEMEEILRSDRDAIIICRHGGKPTGFAHCSLRQDYVEGAERSPTAYLEGVFVMTGHRGEGIAAEMLRSCEKWAAEAGCTEIASDCELDNAESRGFHMRTGFTEANRIICFIKKLHA